MKAAACLALLLALPASATNIVVNPGFEQGIAGWTMHHFSAVSDPKWLLAGGHSVIGWNCLGGDCLDTLHRGSYVSQLLATTPGQQYDLGFWIQSLQGDAAYSVFWDGKLLDTRPAANGAKFAVGYTALVATTSTTLLEVHGRNTPRLIAFDDFSVVPTLVKWPVAAVPEPGALLLMAAGAAALAWSRRRQTARES